MSDRWTHCERGTATVEAVVILPFLVLLFAAALHVHDVAATHQQSQAAARQCAWAHALAGCPKDAPALCEDAEPGEGKSDTTGDKELADVGVNTADFVNDLGFLGQFIQGFLGKSFKTTRSAKVQALMDPESEVEVSAKQVLLCNPSPPKFGKFLKEIFTSRDRLKKRRGK